MADVERLDVEWLWEGRIPLHALTIIEGIEGVGKSTLLAAIASSVSIGKGLPGVERQDPAANIVWLSAEDNLSHVLKGRLEASKADCSRIFAVEEPFTFDQRGLLALAEGLARYTPRLVIIDPIFAYTDGDANKGKDSRALTRELKALAEKFACAIVLVRHIGKSKGFGDPRAAGLYSIEWRAAARSVLLVGADPDNRHKLAITHTKNNLGPFAESLGYSIEKDPDSPCGARFYWKGLSDLTAERILAAISNEDEKGERLDAVDFLRELLKDGPVESKEVEKARKAAQISDYALRRAKASLGIKVRKSGSPSTNEPQKWGWVLPEGLDEGVDEGVEGVEKKENQRLRSNHSDKSIYSNNLSEGVEGDEYQRLRKVSTPSPVREELEI